MKITASLALLGAMASMATAFINPTDPWGDSIWKPNTQVTISWNDDGKAPKLGPEHVFDIYLSTGGDQSMLNIATIATGVKAGEVSNITYTVPEVTPPGKIYFLTFKATAGQFSDVNNPGGLAWSTRFTITDLAGNPGTLKPTGVPGQNPGAIGATVAPGAGSPSATATATSTAAGSAAPSGAASPTSASAAPAATSNTSGAGSVGTSALFAAAAVIVGAAALAL
ncbi:hypothetical protein BC939DRAFT_501870 [Gamsiella multidivaricata]|uniref:uncharacterized protein n=1 Tax=Gamsiella multidivaricata TaxID=101098 RepID=UPI00221F747B|nr:uncharacterized protein BC939DRAFT_501870 [Gamsiella multidivaricata]KAG0366246.1 hypothetical protein BGZ54_005617 [Gamsiella multidivaricata]KAI7826184.1 hypothetical protein BC939DRAFT_501870 [Gamsiella multidivaricata]